MVTSMYPVTSTMRDSHRAACVGSGDFVLCQTVKLVHAQCEGEAVTSVIRGTGTTAICSTIFASCFPPVPMDVRMSSQVSWKVCFHFRDVLLPVCCLLLVLMNFLILLHADDDTSDCASISCILRYHFGTVTHHALDVVSF